MSNFEPRQGIVLFANERQNERQPVMRGIITFTEPVKIPEGQTSVEMEVSLWGKVSKKGSKFWSGEFKPKQERQAPKPSDAAPFDDMADLPF
jgi:hypothetical protein